MAVGAAFTGVIQSSAASVGILQALALTQGGGADVENRVAQRHAHGPHGGIHEGEVEQQIPAAEDDESNRRRDIGRILIGFAILMSGMEMMKNSVSPLADMPGFSDLLTAFRNPLLGAPAP